jgi:hypothetical protein
VTDMSTILRYNQLRKKEGIRESGDCLEFKLASLELPIDVNPINQNPPLQENSQCIRNSAASLSIYSKISTVILYLNGLTERVYILQN